MNIAFWSLAFVILCQIIGFSFWLGKLSEQVKDLATQFNSDREKTTSYRKNERDLTAANFKDAREQTAANFKDERNLLTVQSHNVLPECQNSFQLLTSGLSKLEGKVDMLILMMGKKNG